MKELGPILRMPLFDRFGQPLKHVRTGALPRQLPWSQEPHALPPPRGPLDQLQGRALLSPGALSSLRHQIALKVAGIGRMAGKTSHRDSLSQLMGSRWPFAWDPRFARAGLAHNAFPCRPPDGGQLALH